MCSECDALRDEVIALRRVVEAAQPLAEYLRERRGSVWQVKRGYLSDAVADAIEAVTDALDALSAPAAEPDPLAHLCNRFRDALYDKLKGAERKYGYSDDWKRDDWRDDLVTRLAEHVQKGDPRDVAAYCAFAWHHDWSVAPAAEPEVTP